ncbi:hypothetical protein ACJZ2D_014330 [Fusarium nematophilum]
MSLQSPQLVAIFALWLAVLAKPISGSSVYAFWTDLTIQVGAQDPDTGDIYYSNCNSNSTPIFPVDKPNVLEMREKPRNGTALAAAGWWDTQKIVASVFWHTENSSIINGYYECDMETGQLVWGGDWAISETAEVDSIHNETGLSVRLLGEEEGYRLFYHNEDRQVMMLSYTRKTDWIDGGFVSQDTAIGTALASAHHGNGNVSVAFPRVSKDIEVPQLWKTNEWSLETFPQPLNGAFTNDTSPGEIEMDSSTPPTDFSLPSWDPETEAITMSIDRSRARSIFYIGTDKKLYQAVEENREWRMASRESDKIWPSADNASTSLAVTYQSTVGEVWIYYWSNGSLVQVHMNDSGEWDTAQALPQTLPKDDTDGGGKDDKTPELAEPSPSAGLSTGAKAGIGVGVSVGALLGGGLLVWLWMRRRRDAGGSDPGNDGTAAAAHDDVPEIAGTAVTSPVSTMHSPPLDSPAFKKDERVEPSEMDGQIQIQPAELDQSPVIHELPGHESK